MKFNFKIQPRYDVAPFFLDGIHEMTYNYVECANGEILLLQGCLQKWGLL